MRKLAIFSTIAAFVAGVAIAGEDLTQSESNVKEKTTHSTTTTVQGNPDHSGKTQHHSTTIEQQRRTTTSDDMDGDTTSREKVEVEKHRSKTLTERNDESLPRSTQEYHQQSEAYHQHTTKEVK